MLLDYTEDDLEETFCLNFTVRYSHMTPAVVHFISDELLCLTSVLFSDHRGKLRCHRGPRACTQR